MEKMPKMMIHIEMGSKYFTLNRLNMFYASLPNRPESNPPQQMLSQEESENSHRK
jgi:hypothetical protein